MVQQIRDYLNLPRCVVVMCVRVRVLVCVSLYLSLGWWAGRIKQGSSVDVLPQPGFDRGLVISLLPLIPARGCA